MDSLASGTTVLLIAIDVAIETEARHALEARNLVVLKRYSKNVTAICCAPCEAWLDASPSAQATLSRHRGKAYVFDFKKTTLQSGGHNAATASPVERRVRPWVPYCSHATQDRISRARNQRLYLIEQAVQTGSSIVSPTHRYIVLGSTANVYTVQIGSRVTCDCPDAANGHTCKHQLFVFLRVLRMPASSPLIYQRALLSSERHELFADCVRPPAEADALASTLVQSAYAAVIAPVDSRVPEQRGGRDDNCPICYEPVGIEALAVCVACRNATHADCLRKWAQAKRDAVTCPICRADWPASDPAAVVRMGADGFVNLAREAGIIPTGCAP